jgi:polysaccharide export outer membrane protein
MATNGRRLPPLTTLWGVVLLCAAEVGCMAVQHDPAVLPAEAPRELEKVNLPSYVIEPPDVLLIDAIRVIPKPPYRIEALDVIYLQVNNALQQAPILGPYVVEADGKVNLGAPYGTVRVIGLTIDQAKTAIEEFLKKDIVKPEVSVRPLQSRGLQQIRGEHLVRPDGTISLGIYGEVNVTRLTLLEARAAVERHLSQFLLNPEVTVDVSAYNSKLIYVVYDGGGAGQQVVRLPATGNDTVLDAVSQLYGLSPVANLKRIWVSRPNPAGSPCDQVLPVDWLAIIERGRTETNYQLMPGDRLYVHSDPLVTIDTHLARLLAPWERLFGFTLLGNGTVRALQGSNNNGGSNGGF